MSDFAPGGAGNAGGERILALYSYIVSEVMTYKKAPVRCRD